MREPPESTTVKALLSAANFSDSPAVCSARDAARSFSASNMRSFFLEAASPAAPGEAMAETGPRGDCEGEEDSSLQERDPRGVVRILEDGDDRRLVVGEREFEAAAAAAVAVDMAVRAARKPEREKWSLGKRDRWIGRCGLLYTRRDHDGRPDRAGLAAAAAFEVDTRLG